MTHSFVAVLAVLLLLFATSVAERFSSHYTWNICVRYRGQTWFQ